jgi:hypothetical protein
MTQAATGGEKPTEGPGKESKDFSHPVHLRCYTAPQEMQATITALIPLMGLYSTSLAARLVVVTSRYCCLLGNLITRWSAIS